MSLTETLKEYYLKRREKKKAEKAKKAKMTPKEKVVENIKVIFSAYLIAFVIRLFMIEGYQIPSQSMVPSLRVRDILMVEKLSMGPIIPVTHWKVPGLTAPRRNDIIVFITPDWNNPGPVKELISLLSLSLINLDNTPENPKNLVKRLVGKPGDVISMTNQRLYINGTPVQTQYLDTKDEVVYMRGKVEGYQDFMLYKETYNKKSRIVQHQDLSGYMLWNKTIDFEKPGFIQKFARDERTQSVVVLGFPPIRVPKKGVKIDLTKANAYYKYLLKLLISRESGKKVVFNDNGDLIMDGKVLTSWTPDDDYYFAMGDNRDYSKDCRYFGFIPRKNIFGHILFRYFPFRRMGFNVNVSAKSVEREKLD